jgi:Fe-S cluster biogenesis protein NfuA
MGNEEIILKIKEVIKVKIRPILVMDGGNIEFVDFVDGIVRVKLLGHCHHCPLANITIKSTVESMINEELGGGNEVLVEAMEFDEEEEILESLIKIE